MLFLQGEHVQLFSSVGTVKLISFRMKCVFAENLGSLLFTGRTACVEVATVQQDSGVYLFTSQNFQAGACSLCFRWIRIS